VKVKLSLQEKLRDLRDEKKMTLSELAGATGIPLSTLQRMESQEDMRIGYQEVAALAGYYDVSTDYLFDLTDNRRHRHIEVDALRLSDAAIDVLKSDQLNNRLVSELLAHPDFPRLLKTMEVYIDRKILPQMNTVNAMYKVTEEILKEKFEATDGDDMIVFLQEAVIDEDEYLRYRISERFNLLMKKLFDAHKKDALPDEQASVIREMRETLQGFPVNEEEAKVQRWKLMTLAKQIGLNTAALSNEEVLVLEKALKRSEKYNSVKNPKRKGGRQH